jgi:colanic acid biosynthesis glycosyl transferase WcaI
MCGRNTEMRILMLTQWFDPEPTFKGLAFARELVRLGHEVEVLTGFPNYPGGKLYDGYKVRLLQRENRDGISVVRVPLYPSHDGSALRRIANYVSFAVSSAIMGIFLVKKADVMYVYHPPATVGFSAACISFFRRIPFVYDIQDLWPDTLAATGMLTHRAALKIIGAGCRFVYRRAAKLVVLSPGFKKLIGERGVSENKIEVVYNWCDEAHIQQHGNDALRPELSGRFNVLFAGTMGRAQALDSVLDAAALIAESDQQVQFVFVGGGIDVAPLKQRSTMRGLTNVLFLPRMPAQDVGSLLAACDVLLVHLRDDPLFSITVPSKTQAYMAAGRPVLMAVRGDAAALIQQAGAGICCLPEDSRSIVDAVRRMRSFTRDELEAMGNKGKAFYERNLSLAVGTKKFESVFMSVVKQTA